MTFWQLGCRWGSNTPLFYEFIKNNNTVIGWEDKKYSKGDCLLITDGFTVLALVKYIKSLFKNLNRLFKIISMLLKSKLLP